jgi:3-oxoacyl-[acyl-carrier protein] reductase
VSIDARPFDKLVARVLATGTGGATMLLQNKTAVVYGGGGAIGGAVARAFAREGARVFLAGRTLAKLDRVAAEIVAAGGTAETAIVDALDGNAVDRHADAVAARGAGVILTLSTPGSRMAGVGFLGYGVTCGAVETFSRILTGELGPSGIRVVCLRPDAIPEAASTSHSGRVFRGFAERTGVSVEAMLADRARTGTLLRRLPTLAEVANAAAFVASDGAGAMTGAIVNLTCGSLVD